MRKTTCLTAIFLFVAMPLMASTYSEYVNYTQTILSLTLIGIILLVGGMALRWQYKTRYKGSDSFWRFAWNNPLVKLTAITIALVLGVSLLMPNPMSENSYEQIEFARMRKMPKLAARGYEKLARKFPYSYRYHFNYVAAYYEREEWAYDRGEATVDPDLMRPAQFYRKLTYRDLPGMVDLGRLGLGMCEYYESLPSLAIKQFRKIENEELPYLNLFKGRIHRYFRDLDSANYCFQREFDLGWEKGLAVKEMAVTMYQESPDSISKMLALIDHPEKGKYVPTFLKRYVYTKEARLLPYLGAILQQWANNIHLIGFVGALLGMGVWVFFLRKVNIYKKTNWGPMLMTVAAGAVFSYMALILYDFVEWEIGFGRSPDDPWHDFLYCIFGIGVIEELVKIIPLLLLLQFTKLVRGPLDYVMYASLSALGFAFIENLMYFDSGHIGIIHGRVLVCAVFHMTASSMVAFGLVLAKYRYGKGTVPLFLLFFLLAAFLHGFYDFWLLNDSASPFWFLANAVFVYGTFQYAAFINNGLNNSPVFRGRKTLDSNQLAVFLLVSLVSVLLFEYLALSITYGAQFGNYALAASMGMGSFMMFFVVLNLSNIDIVQGEWFVMRLWNFGTRTNHNSAIGLALRLLPNSAQSVLSRSFPAEGEIIARVKLRNDNRYFLFQFDHEIQLLGHTLEYVLLKARGGDAVIEAGSMQEVSVVVFRDRDALTRKEKRRSDFKVVDFALVE